MQSLNLKEWILLELQITQTRRPLRISEGNMSKFSNRHKWKKYLLNVHKMVGAHFLCVNNQYAKFEYEVMNTVGVTDYTNHAPPKHYGWKKCLSSTQVKKVKKIMKRAQNKRCTFSMCEQSLCKV